MIDRQTFLRAADILEREGKVKYIFIDHQTGCGYCCVGSLMKADGARVVNRGRETDPNYGFALDVTNWVRLNEEILLDFACEAKIYNPTPVPIVGIGTIYKWSDRSSKETVIKKMRKYGNGGKEQDESTNPNRLTTGS